MTAIINTLYWLIVAVTVLVAAVPVGILIWALHRLKRHKPFDKKL